MNIGLLRSSFAKITPQADNIASRFYARMFAVYPQVKPLFKNADPASQRKKLMASIAAVVAMVDKPDELAPVLEKMGASHLDYGVLPEQYDYVCASMLSALAESFGEDWTAETAQTWSEALRHVSDQMIAAQERAAAA